MASDNCNVMSEQEECLLYSVARLENFLFIQEML
jgi:hypothetical protein